MSNIRREGQLPFSLAPPPPLPPGAPPKPAPAKAPALSLDAGPSLIAPAVPPAKAAPAPAPALPLPKGALPAPPEPHTTARHLSRYISDFQPLVAPAANEPLSFFYDAESRTEPEYTTRLIAELVEDYTAALRFRPADDYADLSAMPAQRKGALSPIEFATPIALDTAVRPGMTQGQALERLMRVHMLLLCGLPNESLISVLWRIVSYSLFFPVTLIFDALFGATVATDQEGPPKDFDDIGTFMYALHCNNFWLYNMRQRKPETAGSAFDRLWLVSPAEESRGGVPFVRGERILLSASGKDRPSKDVLMRMLATLDATEPPPTTPGTIKNPVYSMLRTLTAYWRQRWRLFPSTLFGDAARPLLEHMFRLALCGTPGANTYFANFLSRTPQRSFATTTLALMALPADEAKVLLTEEERSARLKNKLAKVASTDWAASSDACTYCGGLQMQVATFIDWFLFPVVHAALRCAPSTVLPYISLASEGQLSTLKPAGYSDFIDPEKSKPRAQKGYDDFFAFRGAPYFTYFVKRRYYENNAWQTRWFEQMPVLTDTKEGRQKPSKMHPAPFSQVITLPTKSGGPRWSFAKWWDAQGARAVQGKTYAYSTRTESSVITAQFVHAIHALAPVLPRALPRDPAETQALILVPGMLAEAEEMFNLREAEAAQRDAEARLAAAEHELHLSEVDEAARQALLARESAASALMQLSQPSPLVLSPSSPLVPVPIQQAVLQLSPDSPLVPDTTMRMPALDATPPSSSQSRRRPFEATREDAEKTPAVREAKRAEVAPRGLPLPHLRSLNHFFSPLNSPCYVLMDMFTNVQHRPKPLALYVLDLWSISLEHYKALDTEWESTVAMVNSWTVNREAVLNFVWQWLTADQQQLLLADKARLFPRLFSLFPSQQRTILPARYWSKDLLLVACSSVTDDATKQQFLDAISLYEDLEAGRLGAGVTFARVWVVLFFLFALLQLARADLAIWDENASVDSFPELETERKLRRKNPLDSRGVEHPFTRRTFIFETHKLLIRERKKAVAEEDVISRLEELGEMPRVSQRDVLSLKKVRIAMIATRFYTSLNFLTVAQKTAISSVEYNRHSTEEQWLTEAEANAKLFHLCFSDLLTRFIYLASIYSLSPECDASQQFDMPSAFPIALSAAAVPQPKLLARRKARPPPAPAPEQRPALAPGVAPRPLTPVSSPGTPEPLAGGTYEAVPVTPPVPPGLPGYKPPEISLPSAPAPLPPPAAPASEPSLIPTPSLPVPREAALPPLSPLVPAYTGRIPTPSMPERPASLAAPSEPQHLLAMRREAEQQLQRPSRMTLSAAAANSLSVLPLRPPSPPPPVGPRPLSRLLPKIFGAARTLSAVERAWYDKYMLPRK